MKPTENTQPSSLITEDTEASLDQKPKFDYFSQKYYTDWDLEDKVIQEIIEFAESKLDDNAISGSNRTQAIQAIFERLSKPKLPLPEVAPELYKNRKDRKEKPDAFVRRVYKPWLSQPGGLPRPVLRIVDESAYRALYKHGIPADLDTALPTARGKAARYVGMSDSEILTLRKEKQRERTRKHLRSRSLDK